MKANVKGGFSLGNRIISDFFPPLNHLFHNSCCKLVLQQESTKNLLTFKIYQLAILSKYFPSYKVILYYNVWFSGLMTCQHN